MRIELNGMLTDFGITRIVKENSDINKVDAFEVSEIRGLSACFAAPESWFRFRRRITTDGSIWQAGDVYAIGVSINELLTRKGPFKK